MFTLRPGEKLVLASASPRRRELLRAAGLEFEIVEPNCDETVRRGEMPQALVERLAELKASGVAKTKSAAWIIGADTIVVVDGEILGKPRDDKQAREMLARLSGRRHFVWGGVALLQEQTSRRYVRSHVSEVEIVSMSEDLIAAYAASGEPRDKAGAYAIQGIGAALVSAVYGSYTNVVGLNMTALLGLLGEAGVLARR